MRNIAPRGKKVRRLGQAFTEKEARILQRRSNPPGQHGARHSKLSEFGLQLKEKQKAKFAYGLTEKQFHNTFKLAQKSQGNTGENLLAILETRLDNVIYRAGLAGTRKQARQIVGHKFITVNEKTVNIPSYKVKTGDVFSIKKSKSESGIIKEIKEKSEKNPTTLPDWISFNLKTLQGKILSLPNGKDHAESIDSKLIVEHYQRI